MPRLIGVFGGTFDPVHNGHLQIAEAAFSQLELDLLIFVPNAQSPLKSSRPSATFEDRVAMLRLAIALRTGLEVSELEGQRGGTSYTIDTLREIAAFHPGANFFLILGSDAIRDFHLWRESREIVKLARLAYVARPGSDTVKDEVDAIRIEMQRMDFSSTGIRERIREGTPIADLVPSAVFDYITTHRLYRLPGPQNSQPA